MCCFVRVQRRENVYNNEEVRNRSLCQWVYNVQYDPARIPACLHYVSGCINRVSQATENQCELVSILLTVRRLDSDLRHWQDEHIQLPVACTLARPPTHHVHFFNDQEYALPWTPDDDGSS